MKLIINAAGIRKGGSAQVAISTIRELKKFPEHTYHIFINSALKPNIDVASFAENFEFHWFDWDFLKMRQIPRRAKILSSLCDKIAPDCVFTVFGPSYWRPRCLHVMGFALGLYLYPESPVFASYRRMQRLKFLLKKHVQLWFFRRDADVLITEAEDVTQRVKRIFRKKEVYTATNNCSPFFREPASDEKLLGKKNPGEIRFLTISAYYSHKNLEIISPIVDSLLAKRIDNVRFVLTLDDANYRRIVPEKHRERIINVGFVQPKDAPALYEECDAMFLPTLVECFSASYPEAMITGRPIVTTDLGFARSICGTAALYFEPMCAADAAGKIERLIGDPDLWAELVRNGHEEVQKFDTPEQRVYKILTICEQAARRAKNEKRR